MLCTKEDKLGSVERYCRIHCAFNSGYMKAIHILIATEKLVAVLEYTLRCQQALPLASVMTSAIPVN